MAASSTLALVLAVAALVVCLPCFKVASGDDASGLGLFSEVFSGVLDYGSGDRVFQGKDRLNILCLGIDYNRDEKGMGYTAGARSDTIFVVSVSPKGDILNVLSIPRDTQVFISDAVGYDKINAAYSIGGIDLAKEVVSRLLQIPIHNYIIVKVAGAAKMVDAVGGLQINVEKDMDYDDNWGQLHIHLRAGNQLLQGEQAVGYARYRMDEEGDRGRIRRQQQTMQALLQRLKDPIVILRIKGIIKAIKENVITDLSFLDMLELVTRYKDFDRKLMRTGTLVGDDAEVNGVSVIIPYETENRKIVAELFSNINTVSPENVQVEVLNGCGDEKLADAVAEELREKGFQVTQADADRQDYQVTRVMDRLGSVAMRTSIESTVRGCQYETYEISAERRGADITVIVGQDQASRMAKPAAPAQDETILIDTGSRTPKGYVDDGQGLSNEHTSMPFEDMDLPADSASGSGDNPGVFDSSSGADEDFPDITSLPVNTLPKAQPAPARAHSPASREEVAHPRSVPSAAHSAPAIPEPRAEEPAAPVAEPVAVPEPEPAPEPIPEPAYEPAQPEAAEPAEPAPDSPADDDAVLPAPVSL
ncbi:LCP family protein [bacterium]|nr:LCP family protein [bacterium]